MQCVLQYQVSCSVAGTLHRVKRSQLKIFDNSASRGILGGIIPINPAGNCGEREAELSHHWQTSLLSPAPTHSESWLWRHCPGHWRNPQTTTTWYYGQDGSDALLLEPHGGKLCQGYGIRRCWECVVRRVPWGWDVWKVRWIWVMGMARSRSQALMERLKLETCCILPAIASIWLHISLQSK